MKKQEDIHTQEGFIQTCIEKDCGQCVSIVDLAVLKKLTRGFDSYWTTDRQDSLSAFDLPTQTGRDSDNPYSQGEVGRTGVAISSINNMMTCFHDIPLDKVSTSMTINSTASTLLALYIVVAESQGVSPSNLRGIRKMTY